MKRILLGALSVLLLGVGYLGVINGPALADMWTVGKVFLSADKLTYIGFDGTNLSLVKAGTTVYSTGSNSFVVGGATLSTTELGFIDGVTAGTAAANKALVLGASSEIATITSATITTLTNTTSTSASRLTTTNAGTVTTGGTTTATEYGDGVSHLTKLAMTAFAIGTSGDNAALAIGASMYTWPTSTDVMVESAEVDGAVTCAISVTTNTPEVGIGTVVGSGANATLTTGTFENIMDGGATVGPTSGGDQVAVAPDVAGTAFRKGSLSTVKPIIKASGGQARAVFLNIAATWADVTAPGACTFTGNAWLKWRVL